MRKKHLVFIVNPLSKRHRRFAVQDAIDTMLNKEQFSFEILYTRYPKHGTDLARAAAISGTYAVIAVGGDGSVNDVMAGLLHTETALGIIPIGSGNGMARTLQIPLSPMAAMEHINRGRIAMADVGFANGLPFISNAGPAFDALIARAFAQSKRRGLAAYSWLVAKHIFAYRERVWQIEIDGRRISETAFIVNIANGRQYGYNFQIAPHASWQDGLLDLIIIKKFPRYMAGAILLRALNGTLINSPYMAHFRGSRITVLHPDLQFMQVDGDVADCGKEVQFSIEKAALKLLVP